MAESIRHLGSVVLKVKSGTLDIDDLVPNPNQPRFGPKEDPELRKSILENNGLFEPILAEPHPEIDSKYLIIDGERRWTNCKILAESEGKEQFKKLPVQIVEKNLTPEERLRAWVTIHRQRKDWSVKEKERTAYRLIYLVGRVKAANIFGVTVREIDKLKEIFELSERFSALEDPDASITYAREIKALAKRIRPPEVEDIIVKKINDRIITSSKQIRELREILNHPKAKEIFLKEGSSMDDAKAVLPVELEGPNFGIAISKDLDEFMEGVSKIPWPNLLEIKGDKVVVEKIRKCKELLDKIEQAIS